MPNFKRFDALVVGGGPAGAACAERLRTGGANVAVLDRETFPRLKLCAGWITTQVLVDVGLSPNDYPYRFNTFETIVAHLWGIPFKLNGVQHSIRRFEFDRFLLDRAGASVFQHTVKRIEERDGEFVVDDEFSAPHIVGAGGTRCPVYRTLFRELNPKATELQAATREYEFPYEWDDARCHLWFFDKGLPGYAWYVPKANGYLNLGIGAMAQRLKGKGDDIKGHWTHFIGVLKSHGLLQDAAELEPKGYSYYLRRHNVGVVQRERAYIVGDSVGLATRDLCEGIGPAIRSGQRAAQAILDGSDYLIEDIEKYSIESGLIPKFLEYMFVGRATNQAG